MLDNVRWRGGCEDIGSITEKDFGQLAAAAFGKVLFRRLTARKASLNGELRVQDKEGALALEVKVEVSNLPFPLSATLAASSTVIDRGSCVALVKKGLADLSAALRSMISTAEGGKGDWTRALVSPEPDMQILGARLLGASRVKSAVEPLSRLLDDPRETVAEAAADALADIGEERAVPLLIGSIRRGDVRSEVRAIEALGRIGGEEARAYLEMAARGHEIPEVRRLSSDLLSGLPKAEKHP